MADELVTRDEQSRELTVSAFESDADKDLQHVDRECFAVPYLVVLQKLSPQCDKRSDKYVEGAEDGMLFNTATGQLYDGEEGVQLILVEFERKIVEWTPREDGGGFRGAHDPTSPVVLEATPGKPGRLVTASGNSLADTRYHFCLLVTEDTISQVVIALASTQIRTSKAWITQVDGRRIMGRNGLFKPPPFASLWRATTVAQSNDKGSWSGWKIMAEGYLDMGQPRHREIYQAAKAFREVIVAGQARPADPESETSARVDVTGTEM